MCGIAGILGPEGSIDAQRVRRMVDAIAHRGPDDRRVDAFPQLALGFARLSIVDLSAAASQPMFDEARRYAVALNGEIYNFKEVRADLERDGVVFRTRSDTEVVLEAYKRWGAACQTRFNGMWAFAIWDAETRELFLSRDRFGVKPLYLHRTAGQLWFASEVKALLAAGAPAEIAPDAVGAVLRYQGADRGTLSFFKDIESLPAGHCLTCRPGEAPRVERWWRTLDHLVEVPAKRADRVALFRETFIDAVRLRLRTDVPSALSLSGGLDSSSVYAAYHSLLAEGRALRATTDTPSKLTPFIVGYPGDAIDESAQARALAAHFGDEPVLLTPTPDGFRELAREVVWHQETIPWNMATLSYHLLYKAIAAHGAKVVLEGHGSDEMLAGYPQFSDVGLRESLRGLRPFRAWSYARALASAQNLASDRVQSHPLAHLLKYVVRPKKNVVSPLFDRSFYATPAASMAKSLKSALHDAFEWQVLPTILRIFDRASMAAGVESRAPFLDWRLVTLVFSLPETDIVREGRTKWIQRAAMDPLLPKGVAWRKGKIGFALPHPLWFRSPAVTGALQEALADGTIGRAPGLDAAEFRRRLERGIRDGFTYQAATELWQAYAYALSLDVFRSHPV